MPCQSHAECRYEIFVVDPRDYRRGRCGRFDSYLCMRFAEPNLENPKMRMRHPMAGRDHAKKDIACANSSCVSTYVRAWILGTVSMPERRPDRVENFHTAGPAGSRAPGSNPIRRHRRDLVPDSSPRVVPIFRPIRHNCKAHPDVPWWDLSDPHARPRTVSARSRAPRTTSACRCDSVER